ncbi:hypothetical protein PR002_g3404 [Phytophthora rubi]|uniref:Uncharacterized protein n=1 Tax=Phytophthora rubi TaxID=129364 RepID=A0A6A3NLY1_9STRA|nr:hypothetical protein PR002_g3404 [Phytophthora rubi]
MVRALPVYLGLLAGGGGDDGGGGGGGGGGGYAPKLPRWEWASCPKCGADPKLSRSPSPSLIFAGYAVD